MTDLRGAASRPVSNPRVDLLAADLEINLEREPSIAGAAARFANYLVEHCREPDHLAAAYIVVRMGGSRNVALGIDDALIEQLWRAMRCADPVRWVGIEADKMRDNALTYAYLEPDDFPDWEILRRLGMPDVMALMPEPPWFRGVCLDDLAWPGRTWTATPLNDMVEASRCCEVDEWEREMLQIPAPGWGYVDARRVAKAAMEIAKGLPTLQAIARDPRDRDCALNVALVNLDTVAASARDPAPSVAPIDLNTPGGRAAFAADRDRLALLAASDSRLRDLTRAQQRALAGLVLHHPLRVTTREAFGMAPGSKPSGADAKALKSLAPRFASHEPRHGFVATSEATTALLGAARSFD